jgi:hypothetical protein
MASRIWMCRLAWLVAGVVTAGGLGGCSLSGIKFTNVSDSWLNVWVYAGTTEDAAAGADDLYRQRALQIEPGTSAIYRLRHDLVHVQVETVSPTWVPTGKEYWLELLTHPPLHIVASGREDKLEFQSFRGEIAIIPQRELEGGRFTYHVIRSRAPSAGTVTSVTGASQHGAGRDG